MVRSRSRKLSLQRSGFTMIELMVVIVIIAVLAALLLPAVRGAIRNTRVAGVKNEISQLESAIAKFKADHGIEPPSQITLYETASDWNLAAAAGSRSQILQMWPQFDFTKNRDLNGSGDSGANNQHFTLSLGECLVFFLGGMPQTNGAGLYAVTGFSKDPTDPFSAAVNGVARDAPLFEFLPSRLAVFGTHAASSSPFIFPAYKDNLPSQQFPYLYYSSYDGLGYQESGPNVEFGSPGLTLAYRQGNGTTFSTADPWLKPNSYQIISPGFDSKYGYGGDYIANSPNPLPVPTTGSPTVVERSYEADNITNFAMGMLQP